MGIRRNAETAYETSIRAGTAGWVHTRAPPRGPNAAGRGPSRRRHSEAPLGRWGRRPAPGLTAGGNPL
eukprot:7336708-Alexandrium_andersonii.AAC.1